MIGGSIKQENL